MFPAIVRTIPLKITIFKVMRECPTKTAPPPDRFQRRVSMEKIVEHRENSSPSQGQVAHNQIDRSLASGSLYGSRFSCTLGTWKVGDVHFERTSFSNDIWDLLTGIFLKHQGSSTWSIGQVQIPQFAIPTMALPSARASTSRKHPMLLLLQWTNKFWTTK